MDLRATLSPYEAATNKPWSLLESLETDDRPTISKLLASCGLADLARKVILESPSETSTMYREYGLAYSAGSTSQKQQPEEVSLYIPCYNGAHYLRNVLPAVLDQSYPLSEVLVIDDGSSDDSARLAESLGAKVIRHAGNKGLAAARNTAIEAAKSPFLACLDADACPDRYWLERLMPLFSDPQVAGVGGRLIEQHTLTVADRWRARMMAQHYGRFPVSQQPIFGCNGVFRTETLRALNGYHESYTRSYEDIDLSNRLLKAGHQSRYHPEALCRHQRKDSPNQVVATCFQWRLPHLLSLGFQDSGTNFGGALGTNLRHDLKEIEELNSTGDLVLTYPSLLMLFQSPLRMTELLAEKLPAARAQDVKLFAAARVLGALARTPLPAAAQQRLRKDLEDLIRRFSGSRLQDLLSLDFSSGNSKSTRQSLQIEETPFTAALSSVVDSIPDVARFKPEIQHGIEQSALECLCDEQQLSGKLSILALDLQGDESSTRSLSALGPSSRIVRGGADSYLSLDFRERIAGAETDRFLIQCGPGNEALGVWWSFFLAAARPSVPCSVVFPQESGLPRLLENSKFVKAATASSRITWQQVLQ